MSTLSEGELHVQAMRLVCEALADREKTGLEVDWDVINQQLDHMDVILQGIADQRVDDADEIKTLRQQLAEQQAETVDVRRQRNSETDRLNATNAVSVQQRDEIGYLRARLDEEQSVSARLRQQLDAERANVESLQQRLTEAQQERVDAIDDYEGQIAAAEALIDPEANGETTIAGMADMILHLRQQLDAANAAVTLQRAGIERMQAFVWQVREARNYRWPDAYDKILKALAELDAEGGA